MSRRRTARSLMFLVLGCSSAALAQSNTNPTFDFAKPASDVKVVIWKASAQGGVLYTTGNSNSLTVSGAINTSRDDGKNRVQLDANVAYARSSVDAAVDANNNRVVDPGEIITVTSTTAQLYAGKLRYDRFFTDHNSGYLAASALSNTPAGKQLVAGGQAGYSRLLLKSPTNEIVTEIGYDLSYREPVSGASLFIHSLRLFTGLTSNLTPDTNVGLSVECLFNLNSETNPQGGADIGAFGDIRVNAKASLTTVLYKNISGRVGFTLRYDEAPTAKPPFSLPYAKGYIPLADTVDTLTEATLVVSFL